MDIVDWERPLAHFITKETHYALERAGYNWDGSSFEGGLTPELYDMYVQKAIAALARNAVNFFQLSKVGCLEKKDPNGNLRQPLKDSLDALVA
ncbi:hypothetical protein HYU11_06555 [Candidatus Woesearchaeota archaeon]|nr:hypothetical protein [Candidatus Woesearchaeota archaeon]